MNENHPIRIAQIVGKYIGGGVESVLMNYYRNIDKNKIQFDFIFDEDSTDIPYKEIELLGGKVILVPPYQKIFKYHKELKRVLIDGNYKIVHSHINTLSVFSLFVAKRAGIPIRIAHSHSTTNKKEKKKNLLKQILKPFSKLFATNYMCCSEHAGRWLFGNKEYDKGNIYLLNNAIDLDEFKYNEELRIAKRKELGIGDNTIAIGHIGRFVEQKNHRFLIDVFNDIYKKNNDSILLLVGKGPLIEEMKEKVNNLKLTDSVKFLGQRDDVNELYQAFDFFLFPSLYEGLGMVAIEAQSSGLLCGVSNEVPKDVNITDKVYYMDLNNDSKEWADKILEILKDINNKRDNYTECIRQRGYDIKEEVRKLEKIYLELERG